MKAETEKMVAKQSRAIASASSARQLKQQSEVQFEDRRPQAAGQRTLAGKADSSPQSGRIAQLQAMVDSSAVGTVQKQGMDEEELMQGKFKAVQRAELEEEEPLQGKFETIQKQEEDEELLQGKFETIQKVEEEEELQMKSETIQKKGAEQEDIQTRSALVQKKDEKPANNTGLPDNLKSGIENLSGLSVDDVKVHYNSAKPAQLQAHAFAQGTDIHMAPGQEKHLPHEAWHVVQQKQGRVKPTKHMKGNIKINDNNILEKEADEMGSRSLQMQSSENSATPVDADFTLDILDSATVQRTTENSVIQKYDKLLHQTISAIEGYAFKDPFMQYTAATNQSTDAVSWKAHVGVQNAKDRAQVLTEAGPVLRDLGINHKFDIKDAEEGIPFQKFITIYPPAEESDWANIISNVEASISVATYFDENAEAGVMGGKIAMRHGQIGAVLPAQITKAGIELSTVKTKSPITAYLIKDAGKVWDPAFKDKLVFHAKAGACFFLTPDPFPAIIWNGVLRPDKRENWNPFKAQLPEGVKTTDEIEWDNRILAYRSSELYKNREQALLDRGEAGRYGLY